MLMIQKYRTVIFYAIKCMQETRTRVPDYILTLKLAPDAPWDKEEGTEKQTEGE